MHLVGSVNILNIQPCRYDSPSGLHKTQAKLNCDYHVIKDAFGRTTFFFSRMSELIVVQDTNLSGVDICIYTEVIFFLFFLPSLLCFLSPLWRIKNNEKNLKKQFCLNHPLIISNNSWQCRTLITASFQYWQIFWCYLNYNLHLKITLW